MSTHVFQSREDTKKWIKSFVAELRRPCVVLLSGPLGAGKTQFVRWLLEELGVQDTASPTFAIHHRYLSRSGDVDHVDLYRVKSDEDLEASGFWDLFTQASGLVFVEWADRLPDSVWPKTWRKIRIALKKAELGESRELSLEIKQP
jgi:tRNA threonylcarbamoyladenosine biosynthesis protein TsaE